MNFTASFFWLQFKHLSLKFLPSKQTARYIELSKINFSRFNGEGNTIPLENILNMNWIEN
jgi:hypothetical protein